MEMECVSLVNVVMTVRAYQSEAPYSVSLTCKESLIRNIRQDQKYLSETVWLTVAEF
jgi:hypothetical protein